MKKESKGRYKVSEQLSDKTSALIMIASGISVLLLMIYFGVSLTSKGTFSADAFYRCPDGGVLATMSTVHKCCPTSYSTLQFVGEENSFLANFGNYVCGNDYYNTDGMITMSNGIGYCEADLSNFGGATNIAVACVNAEVDGVHGFIDSGRCFLPCAKAPISNATEVSCSYQYQNAPNKVLKNDSSCSCPNGQWTYDYTSSTPNICVTNLQYLNGNYYYFSANLSSCYPGYAPSSLNGVPICYQSCQYGSVNTDNNKVYGSISVGTTQCCPDGWRTSSYGTNYCETSLQKYVTDNNGNDWYKYRAWAGSDACPDVNGKTYSRGDDGYCYPDSCPCSNTGDCQEQDQGETIRADQCYKTGENSGVVVWVQTCSKTSSEIQGVTCSSLTDDARGTCYISYTGANGQIVTDTVPRCSIKALDDSACSTTTEPITCYYCDSNNTRRSYTSDTGSCNNSSYPSATTNSNLVCSSSSVTCYRCTANSTTVSEEEFDGDSCPSGWSTTRPSTCSKSCNYCSGTTKKTDNNVPKLQDCSDYNSTYHETSESLNCTPNKKTCYKCTTDSTTPSEQEVNESDNCPSGWSTTVPTCSKSCNYCSGTTKKTDNNVPKLQDCSDYNSTYHETSENLDCSPAKKTCYYCEGTSRKSFTLETSANGNCANSTAHPGATDNSNLKCVEEVKCCACDGTNKVTKDDSTNGKCPSGQTICGELVCTNVQTGSTAIVIAWIAGIMAIGYSFYYFRKTNKQQ